MKVTNVRMEKVQGDKVRFCADITWKGGQSTENAFVVWYEFPIHYESNIDVSGNAFLAATLFPAMKLGENLEIEAPVSPRLLQTVQEIMDVYASWYPALHRIEVSCTDENCPTYSMSGKAGTFFSAGVDSFYSLLKHRDTINDLFIIHGFDIPLADEYRFTRAFDAVQTVAREFGKQAVPVVTNVKQYVDQFVGFGSISVGALLASIGLGLGSRFQTVYIPSSMHYSDLYPRGTHPMTDRLWSTERTTLIHDGCEAKRIDKIMEIAKSEIALKTLRVCYMDLPGTYNCGKCEKCVRTMTALRIAGVLDKATAFEEKLTLDMVRKLPTSKHSARLFVRENIEILRKLDTDKPLLTALEQCYRANDPSAPLFKIKKFIHQADDRLLGGLVTKAVRTIR